MEEVAVEGHVEEVIESETKPEEQDIEESNEIEANFVEEEEQYDSEEDYTEREAGIVISAGKLTESVKRTPFNKQHG